MKRLFDRNGKFSFDVATSCIESGSSPLCGSRAKAHARAKELLEEFGEIPAVARRVRIPSATRLWPIPRRWRELLTGFPVLSKAVVFLALVFIAQNFIRLVDLFEFFFTRFIVRVYIGMVLPSTLSVRLLDLVLRRRARQSEDFVVVLKLNGHIIMLIHS